MVYTLGMGDFPFRRLTRCLVFAGILLTLTHCSGNKVNENDPASMYADAEDEIKSDHYQLALEKLRTVKNKFPYSKYAIDAELRIADVLYMQESYEEAAAAYEAFKDLHPTNPRVDYAQFRIGKSYYEDTPGNVARDLTPAKKALDAFEELIKRFPQSPDVAEAKKDMDELQDKLAEKELNIADFYFKRDFPDSARGRFEKVLADYPDTPAAKEAKKKLAKLPPPKPRATNPGQEKQ